MTAAAELTALASPRASQDALPGTLRLKKHFPFPQRSISAFSRRSDGPRWVFGNWAHEPMFKLPPLQNQNSAQGGGGRRRSAAVRRDVQNRGMCVLLPTGT